MLAHIGVDGTLDLLTRLIAQDGIQIEDEAGDPVFALAFGYRRWLARRQGADCVSTGVNVEVVQDAFTEKMLLSRFIEEKVSDDILDALTKYSVHQAIERRRPEKVRHMADRVVEAMAMLDVYLPECAFIIDLVLTRIFFAEVPLSLGGSTARAIGVVWFNLPHTLGVLDIVELLAHETTHHVLFLDILTHGPHVDPIHTMHLARSAIRRTPRPLSCALDSLVVAVELLECRSHFVRTGMPKVHEEGAHPATDVLLEGAMDTISDLEQQMQLLTPRGRSWLRRSAEILGG